MVSGVTADSSRQEFISLLVTQLQNQDPLEPVKQEEYLGQLAQFSTLEGIEKLNANFAQLLQLQQLTQGTELLGRKVSFTDPLSGQSHEGLVDAVDVSNGQIALSVEGRQVGLDQVASVVG